MLTIILALLIFGIIITVHEFGHFAVAKLSGIKVEKFAIGMGPVILKKQHGETEYSLRLFPVGGFCQMEGENEDASSERSFSAKPPWKRFLVLIAGATMNILLGFILLIIATSTDSSITTTRIESFKLNSSSEQTGLQVGDELLEIGGVHIFSDLDISYKLTNTTEEVFDVVVKRNGERVKLDDVRFYRYYYYYYVYYFTENADGTKTILADPTALSEEELAGYKSEIVTSADGLSDEVKNACVFHQILDESEYSQEELDSFLRAENTVDFFVAGDEVTAFGVLKHAAGTTVSFGRLVIMSLFDILRGKYGLKDMAGPIGIIDVLSEATKTGFSDVIFIAVLITINVGIFNLLPLPALDGGRVVFVIIEAIFRKRVPANVEGTIHAVGFALLMVLAVVIAFSDVLKLFK